SRQTVLPAPIDERSNRGAQQFRIAAIFERSDRRLFEVDDRYLIDAMVRPHVPAPQFAEWFVRRVPRQPLRLSPELRRRLSRVLPERARKRLRPVVTAGEGDVDDAAVVAERERVRRALQTHEPHVL